MTIAIPPERARAAQAISALLGPGRRVALTTHVNADGDGVGSEVALWHLLTACIDHHVSQGSLPGGPRLVAPEAAATAELVFDLATALDWDLTPDVARALYVGILTDTGAFRFANTTPRVLQVASALLGGGVD